MSASLDPLIPIGNPSHVSHHIQWWKKDHLDRPPVDVYPSVWIEWIHAKSKWYQMVMEPCFLRQNWPMHRLYVHTHAFFKRESFADTSWISLGQSRMVTSLPYWLWRIRERWFSALYAQSRLKHGMWVVLCEGWNVCCNRYGENVETWLGAIENSGKTLTWTNT